MISATRRSTRRHTKPLAVQDKKVSGKNIRQWTTSCSGFTDESIDRRKPVEYSRMFVVVIVVCCCYCCWGFQTTAGHKQLPHSNCPTVVGDDTTRALPWHEEEDSDRFSTLVFGQLRDSEHSKMEGYRILATTGTAYLEDGSTGY